MFLTTCFLNLVLVTLRSVHETKAPQAVALWYIKNMSGRHARERQRKGGRMSSEICVAVPMYLCVCRCVCMCVEWSDCVSVYTHALMRM